MIQNTNIFYVFIYLIKKTIRIRYYTHVFISMELMHTVVQSQMLKPTHTISTVLNLHNNVIHISTEFSLVLE